MSAISLLLAVVYANAWLFPTPTDKWGWGLRIRMLESHEPYLVKENLEQRRLAIALINQSVEGRECIPLEKARDIGDLRLRIVQPDGKTLQAHREDFGSKPVKDRSQIASGQLASSVFLFRAFGYGRLEEPGEYELRASLKMDEGMVVAPVVKFKVIEPAAADILVSQAVPLEGQFSKWPKEKQDRAVVQQIKIGKRTWLFYRKFLSPELGGKVSKTFRIAELPGKVEDMKVQGSFGDWNPLTITYRETTYTKWTTTHVINSVDGRPWTAGEEKHLQEKLKREGQPAPISEKK